MKRTGSTDLVIAKFSRVQVSASVLAESVKLTDPAFRTLKRDALWPI